MSQEGSEEHSSSWLRWLPWIALALVWLASVQVRPLLDPDEGRYAEIPREMLASGDWITPRLDALEYLEKPPLQYWATAIAYRVLGFSQGAARLWTVGLAFLCLPMVYAWTARLYGKRAGLAALAALAVSPLFVILGHLGLLDAGFTFWLTAMVLAFTRAQTEPVASRQERMWMLAAWLCAALAVLTKGIVVGVLAGGSLIIYTLLERDARPWRRMHWLPGVALFLLVAAPWFVLVAERNPGFLQFFFIHEHFTRFLTTVHRHAEPWWFFLAELLVVGVLPWVVPLARALPQAWQGEPAADTAPTRVAEAPRFNPLKFLLVFAAFTLVFFSLSGSKLPPYILPMLPPLAAVAGVYASGPSFFRGIARLGALYVCIAGIGVLVYCLRKNNYIPQEVVIWVAVAIVAVAAAVIVTWRGGNVAVQALAAAAAATLAWQALLCAYTATPPQRTARDLVQAVRPYIHPGTTLYTVGQYRQTISPYLQRTLILIGYDGELRFGLKAQPGKQQLSLNAFPAVWRSSHDAVAFFNPRFWDRYRRQGLPGHVVAADYYTVVVSRS